MVSDFLLLIYARLGVEGEAKKRSGRPEKTKGDPGRLKADQPAGGCVTLTDERP